LIGIRQELAGQYASALQEYLSGSGEAGLQRAYELGRKAIGDGLGVLEMVAIHETSLLSAAQVGQAPDEQAQTRQRAANFLLESLSQFEMALRGYQEEVKRLKRQLEQDTDPSSLLLASPKLTHIVEIARQVAGTDVPVLILGESGVGKEVLARFIHAQSGRSAKPFIKVNCAALPHDLLESELFGHERGAFTGALNEKPGKFELADKGTILLDEIADMSPQLQAKLLHVLQDGEFARLGGRRTLKVDARVLAATNKQMEEAVSNGAFREDLYYRLNVISIEIPPLRDRREDIPLLCTYFIEKYGPKYKSSVRHLRRELLEAFLHYEWPGNVRQLENVVKRFLILPNAQVTLEMLKETAPQAATPSPSQGALNLKEVSAHAAEEAEKKMVLRMLEETNWNRKQAAQELGICYKALLNKLKKWGVEKRPGLTRSTLPST
jgi:two-component system response regulator AtoC